MQPARSAKSILFTNIASHGGGKETKVFRNRIFMALLAAAALGMSLPSALAAQSTTTNDTAPQALLVKLSASFDVPLSSLQALSAQGYKPGEIWLALTLAKVSGKSLDEVISLTNGRQGHGWGVVAQILGIDEGSPQFVAMVKEAKIDNPGLGSDQGRGRSGSAGPNGASDGRGAGMSVGSGEGRK